MTLTAPQTFDLLRATWPPARVEILADWQVPVGEGGGQRVSSAIALCADPDIAAMESCQESLGQTLAVQIGPGQEALDQQLEARGYALADPTVLLVGKAATMAAAPPPVTIFTVEGAPLSAQKEIWAQGGIGPARLAVMARAHTPRATFLARMHDTPLATAFISCHEDAAMLHALEVLPGARRQGLARYIMGTAALWAQNQGKTWLSVAVTQGNAAARELYASLGMKAVGQYHYRKMSSG